MTALILIPGLVIVALALGVTLAVVLLGPRRPSYDPNAAERDLAKRRRLGEPSVIDQPLSVEERTL